MTPEDTGLLITAVIGLITALSAWVRAETVARTAAGNGQQIADLRVVAAGHGEQLNGLMAGHVQAIMAPVLQTAVETARTATKGAIDGAISEAMRQHVADEVAAKGGTP